MTILNDNYSKIEYSERKKIEFPPDISAINDQNQMDSFRPLSQRVNFILIPQQNQKFIDEDFSQVELDFKELLQLQQSQRTYRQNNQQINISPEEEEEQKKSSSVEQQQHSILKQLKDFRTKLENNIQQSNQPSTSKTTSSGTNEQIIKNIYTLKRLNPNLQKLCFINVLLLITILIAISVTLQLISANHIEAYSKVENIIQPYEFNKYFCQTFIYGWVLLEKYLNLTHSSKYIENRIEASAKQLSEVVFLNLYKMQQVFIEVDSKGLIPPLKMEYIIADTEYDVDFQTFQSLIQDKFEKVLHACENFEKIKWDEDIIYQVLFIKSNIDNSVSMNESLIEGLKSIFFDSLDEDIRQLLTLVVTFIILFTLIIVLQFHFWQKIKIYEQRILLITSRLQENDALLVLTKLNIAKEILIKSIIPWQKMNYFKLIFLPLNLQNQVFREQNQKYLKSVNDSQLKQNKQSSLLTTRIQSIQFSKIQTILSLIFIYSLLFFYLLGCQLFYSNQYDQLKPSQQLGIDFLQFSLRMDSLVAASVTVKSEYLVIPVIKQRNILTVGKAKADNYYNKPDDLIIFFRTVSGNYGENIFSIYDHILNNNRISKDQKSQLYGLYQNSFCEQLADQIPFCQFKSKNYDEFSNQYGPPWEVDNNYNYIYNGLIGLYSEMEQNLKLNFVQELDTGTYIQDSAKLSEYQDSEWFIRGVVEHVLDSTKAFDLFISIIFDITKSIMVENLRNINIYVSVIGSVLFIFTGLFMFIWIIKKNEELQLLRLSLLNIPIEVLQDQNIISMLKKLYND